MLFRSLRPEKTTLFFKAPFLSAKIAPRTRENRFRGVCMRILTARSPRNAAERGEKDNFTPKPISSRFSRVIRLDRKSVV